MSEQQSPSSAVVLFRAFVMLVCLIAIPLAALFGSSLPGVIKALREGRLPAFLANAMASGQPQNVQNQPGEPARFVPAGPTVSIAANTAATPVAAQRPALGDPPPLAPRWPGQGDDASTATVVRAGFQAPAEQTDSGLAVVRAVPQNPFDRAPADRSPAAPAGDARLVPVAAGADPYALVQDRLRQLGATYYLLESWGDQQREYRFYCRMAVGGNKNYTRSFDAIEADPLQAMTQVLHKVETWRADRP